MLFGKKTVTEVRDDRIVETTQAVSSGKFVLPRKIHTEESIEIHNRAEQDAEYIHFADEEERLSDTGRLLEAEFQVRRTVSASKRGVRYAVKKFTVLDNNTDNSL